MIGYSIFLLQKKTERLKLDLEIFTLIFLYYKQLYL